MVRLVFVIAGMLLLCTWQSDSRGGGDDQAKKKKAFADMVLGGTDKFLERFDKNKDGQLTKDELPPFFVKVFEKFDRDSDGKLSRAEVEAMLKTYRVFLEKQGQVASGPAVEKMVDKLLAQMDTDKDGKISKAEAKGQVAKNFTALDLNKDGFLDRAELRPIARQMLNAKQPAPVVDFDALDKNADGRLTRDELKGTRFEAVFDQIDTNRDGRIDPSEFEAYLKKLAEKQKQD
jgi:Ca2+-binding EF-hand superfamily protein